MTRFHQLWFKLLAGRFEVREGASFADIVRNEFRFYLASILKANSPQVCAIAVLGFGCINKSSGYSRQVEGLREPVPSSRGQGHQLASR